MLCPDNPDSFALVALRDIPGGTEIFMTDNGWMGEEIGFRSGEGHMKFSVHASAVVPAGTVWCYPEAVSSTTTMLPASLEGSDAYCVVSNVDNSVYMGGTSGTASDLLAWVSNSSLWSGSDSVSMSLDQIGSFSVFADPT
eukprot:g20778.t1